MCTNRRICIVLAISVLFLSRVGPAEVAISLPLEGHYRAGRYMPVRMIVRSQSGIVRLEARGAAPSEIESSSDIDAIIPWLAVTEAIREPHWLVNSVSLPVDLPLHPLGDDERLVGLAGEDADIARSLFASKRIVPITLDVARALLDPPEAWNCLDAVILSESAAARLSVSQRHVLLAGGTLLAVRSARAPDSRWPWKQQGAYWIMRYEPAGPISLIEPAAYAPTYSWDRGLSLAVRRQVLFVAVIFALLALGVTLWRSRWTFVAFCGASAGLLVWWHGRQTSVLQMTGGVVVVGPDALAQVDRWTWQSPLRRADVRQPAGDLTFPLFASLRQIEQTQICLRCAPDGRPESFAVMLDRNQSIAFLQRELRTDISKAPLVPAMPPMRDLASDLYLQRSDAIVGQFHSDPPVVVVRRAAGDH